MRCVGTWHATIDVRSVTLLIPPKADPGTDRLAFMKMRIVSMTLLPGAVWVETGLPQPKAKRAIPVLALASLTTRYHLPLQAQSRIGHFCGISPYAEGNSALSRPDSCALTPSAHFVMGESPEGFPYGQAGWPSLLSVPRSETGQNEPFHTAKVSASSMGPRRTTRLQNERVLPCH
jgi:hypothetical protein